MICRAAEGFPWLLVASGIRQGGGSSAHSWPGVERRGRQPGLGQELQFFDSLRAQFIGVEGSRLPGRHGYFKRPISLCC